MKTFLLFLSPILLPAFSLPSSSVSAYPLAATETELEVKTETETPPAAATTTPLMDEDVMPLERHTEPAKDNAVKHKAVQEVSPGPDLKTGKHAVAFGKSILFFLVAALVTFVFQVVFIEPKMKEMDKKIRKGKLSDVDTWDHIAAKHPVLNGISWVTYALSLVTLINMIYRGFRTLFQVVLDVYNNPLSLTRNEGFKP